MMSGLNKHSLIKIIVTVISVSDSIIVFAIVSVVGVVVSLSGVVGIVGVVVSLSDVGVVGVVGDDVSVSVFVGFVSLSSSSASSTAVIRMRSATKDIKQGRHRRMRETAFSSDLLPPICDFQTKLHHRQRRQQQHEGGGGSRSINWLVVVFPLRHASQDITRLLRRPTSASVMATSQ